MNIEIFKCNYIPCLQPTFTHSNFYAHMTNLSGTFGMSVRPLPQYNPACTSCSLSIFGALCTGSKIHVPTFSTTLYDAQVSWHALSYAANPRKVASIKVHQLLSEHNIMSTKLSDSLNQGCNVKYQTLASALSFSEPLNFSRLQSLVSPSMRYLICACKIAASIGCWSEYY